MTYYVILNGQQAGPVDEGQLLSLGVTRDTLVWRSGLQQWQAAGSVAELAYLFNAPSRPQTSSAAIWPGAVAGLVLGICSLQFCLPVIGLVFGIIGMSVTKQSYREYVGNPTKYAAGGMLKAARILSRIGFIIGIVVTAIFVTALMADL